MGILAWTPRGPARRVVVVLPFAIEFGSGIRRGLQGKSGVRPPKEKREGEDMLAAGGWAGAKLAVASRKEAIRTF